MQQTLLTRKGHGGVEERVGAVGEVHHEPVRPAVVAGDVPDVVVDRGDPVGDAVSLGVAPEVFDRGRVQVDGDAFGAACGRRDRERPDAGEHVEHPFVGVDPADDPVAFGRETGREVHRRDVEFERTAVLTVDRLGAVPAQHVPPADAEFALDRRGAVDDRPGPEIGSEDRVGDPAGTIVVVLVEDDDVAEPLVGGIEPEDILREGLCVAAIGVAGDDIEPVRLGDRLRIDSRIERDIYRPVGGLDPVLAGDRVGLGEQPTDPLAVLAGDPDAGNRHAVTSVIARRNSTVPARKRGAFAPGAPNQRMLTFVGLGLYDERSITVEGREAIAAADRVFAEFYTSKLAGTTVEALGAHHGVEIEVRDRPGVERDPEPILDAAASGAVVFLTAGDTMISTTHVDLRLRAAERGIDTRIVHGTTAGAAAASLTGLQNYRFGKATTLPFDYAHGGDGVPGSVLDTIADNRERGLHTLVYLDIKIGIGPSGADPDHEEYMTASHAAGRLAGAIDAPGVAVARAGGPEPVVAADRLPALAERDFGEPLHLLVVPGDLHVIERDALLELGGAPEAALPDPV